MFTIDDGAQAPVILAAKDRSIIAATFTKFLLRNIGKYMSHFMRKPVLFHVQTTKVQISLCIRVV